MKKVFYIIIIAILSVIIIFNMCSLLNISFFGYRVFKIATGSMEPYLKVGEIVLIKDSNKYSVNDVVTYRQDNVYITHRIVEINKDNIITKGDANNTNDNPITKDKIVGKLVLKLEIVNFFNYLMAKPFTWVLLFLIGLVIILLIPNYRRIKNMIVDDDII